MEERAGRGWRLSEEAGISLVGDSRWEPDDPPGLDLPVCLLLPLMPLFSGQSQAFPSPMFFVQTKRPLTHLTSRKHVHSRNKPSCRYPNLDTKEGKITRAEAVGWSACH